MAGVRLLVGTKKGAFVLTSDGKRKQWEVSGPHFAGWEIYHLKGSLADPGRIYASQTSVWFGQVIQRSDDAGLTWAPVGNKFVYEGVPGTHQWYDGTQHPWEFKRVWRLAPAPADPDTVYAGMYFRERRAWKYTSGSPEGGIYKSTDAGATWTKLTTGLPARTGRP